MGFKDLVSKAVAGAKREGDYILANQRGQMEVQSFKVMSGQSGKFAVLLGKLLSVKPKVEGGVTQPVGSLLKIFVALYGDPKKQAAGYSNIKSYIMELTGATEDEVGEALEAVFGDHAEGITDNASDKAKAGLLFEAKGLLVDFDSYEVEKDGKKYARVKLHNVPEDKGNTKAEIEARKKAIG